MLAALTIHLYLPACTSLKEKRGRIKPLISRLHLFGKHKYKSWKFWQKPLMWLV